MVRTVKRSRKRDEKMETGGVPRFSAAFLAEVGGCRDIAAFQELLERKGLWLNRNAAEGVFAYLRAMSDQRLRDEDLTGVVGGVYRDGLPGEQVMATLQILSDQLNGIL